MPKAVIFDLDGVLLNTEPLYFEATQRVLTPYQKQYSLEHQAKIMGQRPMEASLALIELYGLPISALEYQAAFLSAFDQLLDQVALTTGAEALLVRLKALSLPIAIASSSSTTSFQHKTVRYQPFFQQFETIVLGDDPHCLYGKPHPNIFLLAAERLGVAPDDCLVFEDAPNGILAARRAGMQVVAICDPRFDKGLYREAHACFESLEHLPNSLFTGDEPVLNENKN